MSVAAITPATQALNSVVENTAGVPSQVEIERFNQLMFNTDKISPEQKAIDLIHKNHEMLANQVLPSTQATIENPDVENMLATQNNLLRTSVTVDLEAKIAGQMSQAINKLVSMQ